MRLSRHLLCLSAVAVLVLIPTTAAHAGVLVKTVGQCEGRALERPFVPWLDPMTYTLVSEGSFEAAPAGWALTGGASRVDGNETHYVHGADDGYSLALPPGSSATTPSTCVGLEHPTLRFFARNTGSALSTLRVDVRVETSLGLVLTVPLGVVAAGSSWQPTLPMPVLVNLLPLLPGQYTPVAFRFTPLGGNWRIDDVYVDPRSRR
jgi:hypothetical protein